MLILLIYIIFIGLLKCKINAHIFVFKKKSPINSNEDLILSKFNHENIIKLKKVETKFNLFKILYLENFEAPALSKLNVDIFLKDKNWEDNVKKIIYQILNALKHIHDKGYIHNDIHPGNILYDNRSKKIMLIDFDNCVSNNSIINSIGSRYYTAPEKVLSYLKGVKITNKIDIYSLGCIFHVLLTGYTIYWNVRANKIYEKDEESNGLSFNHLNSYSDDCLNLLYKMLYKNPSKRISTEQAINHNWFRNKL